MVRKLFFGDENFCDNPDVLVFFKPFGSKLHRVYKMPLHENTAKYIEVEQVLNTICTVKQKEIWYFNITELEVQQDINSIFKLMGVPTIFITIILK